MITGNGFGVVLRGYDRRQVDALIGRTGEAIRLDGGACASRDELLAARIDVRMRGTTEARWTGSCAGSPSGSDGAHQA